MQAWIFRFVSILGERYSHGHVFDFHKQLSRRPDTLDVLGDGKQRKSYLYVQDSVGAMLLALEKAADKVNLFNLGTDEYCTVDDSIGWITGFLGLDPVRRYTGGDRGWTGDSPFVFLDCSRIRALGWRPSATIREGVLKTIEYLASHPQVLESRAWIDSQRVRPQPDAGAAG
jgi:UDP-glucose 4-epimerase